MALKLAAAIIVPTLLAALMGTSALAMFTDTDSVSNIAFIRGAADISTTPNTALVTFSNMQPGDSVVGDITVTNNGSLEARHAVTSTTTENTLAAQLHLTIWDEAEEGDGDRACNTTPPVTVLYGPAKLGSTTGINVIGNPAQGFQVGDRTLAPGASDVLCLLVSLPLSTGNSFQGLTTAPTFDFAAEQTKNNP
jgi:hypothetical protein